MVVFKAIDRVDNLFKADATKLILRAKKLCCLLCAPTGRAAKRLSEATDKEVFNGDIGQIVRGKRWQPPFTTIMLQKIFRLIRQTPHTMIWSLPWRQSPGFS